MADQVFLIWYLLLYQLWWWVSAFLYRMHCKYSIWVNYSIKCACSYICMQWICDHDFFCDGKPHWTMKMILKSHGIPNLIFLSAILNKCCISFSSRQSISCCVFFCFLVLPICISLYNSQKQQVGMHVGIYACWWEYLCKKLLLLVCFYCNCLSDCAYSCWYCT